MFGENLRKLRKENRYTQAALAQELNLDASSISKYEKTGTIPPADVVAKIATIFHVSADDLLGLETKKTPSEEGVDLSIAEAELVKDFRQLTNDEKEFVLTSVRAAVRRRAAERNQ